MKYLLKIKKKQDSTVNVAVYASEYKEFDNITQIVKYVYENSIFIEKYTIYEMEVFENSKSDLILTNKNCTSNIIFNV